MPPHECQQFACVRTDRAAKAQEAPAAGGSRAARSQTLKLKPQTHAETQVPAKAKPGKAKNKRARQQARSLAERETGKPNKIPNPETRDIFQAGRADDPAPVAEDGNEACQPRALPQKNNAHTNPWQASSSASPPEPAALPSSASPPEPAVPPRRRPPMPPPLPPPAPGDQPAFAPWAVTPDRAGRGQRVEYFLAADGTMYPPGAGRVRARTRGGARERRVDVALQSARFSGMQNVSCSCTKTHHTARARPAQVSHMSEAMMLHARNLQSGGTGRAREGACFG